MSNTEARAVGFRSTARRPAIRRLLFVADAALADVDELPPAARAIIDAAADVYVLTPTLPGRLAWLADDVDRFRHVADERLDTIMVHMRTLGTHVSGAAIRGSVMTVIADAVAEFEPDHMLIALRDTQHANWQEHNLIAHIAERFGLPLTTYRVDSEGHTPTADGPLVLCYDGSEESRNAIQLAAGLFAGRHALVVTVRQPATAPSGLVLAGEAFGMTALPTLDAAAAEAGDRVAEEGVRIAHESGLDAEPIAVEAAGPIWKTIVDIADRDAAAMIVMGSRGLTGVRAMLLSSVSSAVVQHADRPTLIIRHSVASP